MHIDIHFMESCLGNQLLPIVNLADRGELRKENIKQLAHARCNSRDGLRVIQRLEQQKVLYRRSPCIKQEVCQKRRKKVLYLCNCISTSKSGERDETTREERVTPRAPDALLCLSNGHGEDTIAVAILKCLQNLVNGDARPAKIDAFPLVGLGNAYKAAGITTIGPAQVMPSGGFLYMDGRQLFGDVQAGLLQLTVAQWGVVSEWRAVHPTGVILAVGDIFPLAMAWLASQKMRPNSSDSGVYAFVGTAKSEYYLRDEKGIPLKGHKRPILEQLLSPKGVHLPWECALMAPSSCKLVATRDGLTRDILRAQLPKLQQHKVTFLGNPMMDGLEPTGSLDPLLHQIPSDYRFVLLPGSRSPEVYSNFQLLLACCEEVAVHVGPSTCLFLTPLIPSVPQDAFFDSLQCAGWQQVEASKESPCLVSEELPFAHEKHRDAVILSQNSKPGVMKAERMNLGYRTKYGSGSGSDLRSASSEQPIEIASPHWTVFKRVWESSLNGSESTCYLALVPGAFWECIHAAQAGIAMAGTATEQLVGLGKPAFTLPGSGPQFTYQFAEAQSRLLGKSVILCNSPKNVAKEVSDFLRTPPHNIFHANGFMRMGGSGGANRIAEEIRARCFRRQENTT